MESGVPALELRGVTRRFGGVEALRSVSFSVATGEIVGLLGPNGSGKTTLVNAVSGVAPPQEGQVLLRGRDVAGERPHRIARLGLARSYQQVRLFPTLEAQENVRLGALAGVIPAPRTDGGAGNPGWGLAGGAGWGLAGPPDGAGSRVGLLRSLCAPLSARRRERAAREAAVAALARLGVAQLAGRRAGALAHGDQRRVELARAIAARPCVLLLDEPVAGLGEEERPPVVALIQELSAAGVAVVVVEHSLALVRAVAGRVIVLDAGRVLADGAPAEVFRLPEVRAAFVGPE